MEIVIKDHDKKYKIIDRNPDMTVEILNGENILKGIIKSISSNGTYIIEIMEKQIVWYNL